MMSNGPWTSRAVVPRTLADDLDGVDLVGAAQDVDAPEALLVQPPERPLEVPVLPGDDVIAEVAVGPLPVALDRDRLGDVDDDRVDQHVVAPGQLDQRCASGLLHVGGVDDRQQAAAQPGADDVVEDVEGVRCGGLVVLVVGDQAAAEVAGDDLGGLEVACARTSTCRCPRRRPGRPDPWRARVTCRFSVDVSHRCPPSG